MIRTVPEYCETLFAILDYPRAHTFCAESARHGTGYVDDGAGIVCAGQLVGLMSFGLFVSGYPSVFVNVTVFGEFIDSAIEH